MTLFGLVGHWPMARSSGMPGMQEMVTAHDLQWSFNKLHTMFWLGSQHVGSLVEPHWLTGRL